jgi:uncharacterized caspase-like protein
MLIRKICVAAFVLLCAVTSAFAAGKVALVIGNGAYINATPLPNPTNDATDITAKLQELGFTVIGGNDLDYAAMGAKIGEFEDVARDADVTLLFYAGHGMQVNGRNFLVPINAKLERESSLQFESIDAETILRSMSGPGKTAIALLDACRDNPLSRRFARSLGVSRSSAVQQGLAVPAISGGGMLIGFATAPGDVAADGDGRNSPFTAALLKNMSTPGLEIQQLMTRVKGEVFASTKETQEPWHNSSLRSEVYLLPGDASAPPVVEALPAPAASDVAVETAWSDVKDTNSPAVLDAFIARFPNSALYIALAQERKASLAAPVQEAAQDTALALNETAPTAAPEGDSPPDQPNQNASFDGFLGELLDILNDTNLSNQTLQTLKLLKPDPAPGSKTRKLGLKRTAMATSFEALRNKVPDLPADFENFTTCRSDFLAEGCSFMSRAFSGGLVDAMEQRGLDLKKGPVFRFVQIGGSEDVLFTTSPKMGDGEVTMIVAVIAPEMTVKSSFLIDISRGRLGIDAGDADTRYEITGAHFEDGDMFLSIDSGLRCKANKPIARNVGFTIRASLANLKVKWVSPFDVSNANMVSDGVSLYTTTVGSCAASYLYQLDIQTGDVIARDKLPNGGDKLMLVGDTLYLQHYPSASVYKLPGAN